MAGYVRVKYAEVHRWSMARKLLAGRGELAG
jgi:hypothetical protein